MLPTTVFICMPYGDDIELRLREARTAEAMDIWHKLTDYGFRAFCPHLSHFLHEYRNRPRLAWLSHALFWLDRCDCLLAIGEPTAGMKEEIRVARATGKPVFTSTADLIATYIG